MNYFTTVLLIGIALLTLSPAWSETHVHPVGVEVTYPDAWVSETDEDNILLTETDESTAVWIAVCEADDDMDAVTGDALEALGGWIDDIKVTNRGQKATLNGLQATLVEGTGLLDGVEANWMIAFVNYEASIVMIAGWGERVGWDPKGGPVVKIIRSVKPSR